MIPDIGLMVGFYIITRMISLMRNDKGVGMRIVAGFTILTTLFFMMDLAFRTQTPMPTIPSF